MQYLNPSAAQTPIDTMDTPTDDANWDLICPLDVFTINYNEGHYTYYGYEFPY